MEEQRAAPPLDSLPEALRGLDASVLHRGILDAALEITPDPEKADEHLRYTDDAEQAIDWVDASEAQAAILMNPTSKDQLMSVAEAGLSMPAKSTYFYPKVLTGLVVNLLEPFGEICRIPRRIAAGSGD